MELQASKLWQTIVARAAPALTELIGLAQQFAESGGGFDPTPLQRATEATADLLKLRADLAQLEARRPDESWMTAWATDIQIETFRDRIASAAEKLRAAEQELAERAAAGFITIPLAGAAGVTNPPPLATGGGGKSPADVIRELQFQIEQLGRTAREQDIFKALQTAGVAFGSATGQTIAALVDQLHKLKLGQDVANEAFKRGAEQAAEQDRQRADAVERSRQILDERNALVAGFDLELRNREALLAALRDSAAAYETEARFQEMAQQFRAMGLPLYGEEIANVRALAEQFAALDKQTEGITRLRGELAGVADTINNDLSQSVADLVGGVKTLDRPGAGPGPGHGAAEQRRAGP